jgi:MYXO-CTERM domain-containing protein
MCAAFAGHVRAIIAADPEARSHPTGESAPRPRAVKPPKLGNPLAGLPLALAAGMRSSALLLVLAAGCTGGYAPVDAIQQEIIGGSLDTGDPAVVLLFQTIAGQQGGAICTGEVISPHVILTAAHCTGGEDPAQAASATWRVYLGSDFGLATARDLLPVKEAHFNPAFDVKNLTAGNDVGVAILRDPLPASITPLPFNRTGLDSSHNGKQVRFVGYGLSTVTIDSAGNPQGDGAGVKRQTTTTLTEFNTKLLHFADGTHETCNGDSGGPAFMNIGGREVIIGVTSFGDISCSQGGFDTRIDTITSFIDPYVQANDPGFISSGSVPSSPSGGAQSPPTSSATPTSPSPTGAGGVGASCVYDHDCQSGLCGLDNKGQHSCSAANSLRSTAGGCAVGGEGAGAGAGGLGLGLMLVMVLTLGRRRRSTQR